MLSRRREDPPQTPGRASALADVRAHLAALRRLQARLRRMPVSPETAAVLDQMRDTLRMVGRPARRFRPRDDEPGES